MASAGEAKASPRVPVFLDASVIVAASRSVYGGSARVLRVCASNRFRGLVSEAVLLEARMSIVRKFDDPDLVRYYKQIALLEPEIVARPDPELLKACAAITSPKDARVLAAAIAGKAAYLLTLDRRHLLSPKVAAAGLSVKIMTPGDFLQVAVDGRG
ncbi:MAG: PIN domain-containing protein [SAR202 cluster bacterium]|nr:PIN domain-containing protein [SAR202 cluster bacterium]